MSEGITRERADTQARLLSAAVGVFADRGVLAGTIEEICERAGFSRGAFYSNFESKDELVLALLARGRQQSIAGVAGLVSDAVEATPSDDMEKMLQMALGQWVQAQSTDREWILASTEIRLYAAREPGIRAAYLEHRDAANRETVAALQQVVDRYGLELSMPISVTVEMLTPVFEACMLDAVMRLPDGHGDIKQLEPETLAEVMLPMTTLINRWVVGIAALGNGPQRSE
ncbi:MAG: helix-turn-helix domain-containing protein [Brooklawnia sp.]